MLSLKIFLNRKIFFASRYKKLKNLKIKKFSQIKKLYIGAMEPKFGSVGSKVNLLEKVVFNHTVEVEKGVCEEESVKLLQDFFKELRIRNKERKNK